MENATKALGIAAGVLIGVMILSIGVILFADLQGYVDNSHEQIEFNELNKFNTQFTKYVNYIGDKKQFNLTIHDIVTVANLAYENNIKYNASEDERGNENTLYVAVYLDNEGYLESNIQDKSADLLRNKLGKEYKCTGDDISFSNSTGRVFMIRFFEE